jgi:hypothetical protein
MKLSKIFNLLILGVSLALALVAVAACGGGGPEELEIAVKLEGDKLNPETIQVGQGDTVTLKIEPDRPGQVHLHGYDIERDLEADQVTELIFVAEATGRFRITFHAAEEEHQSHNGEQPGPDPAGQNGTPESDGGSREGDHDEGEELDIGFLEVRPR